MIRGVIFDLDGTLVDSQLDFAAMRRDMGFAEDVPILEGLARLAPSEAERCRSILLKHELAGAQRATLLPGVAELCHHLAARGMRMGIATRNSHEITQATLAKFNLRFNPVMTRDDGPVKPDPWPVQHACSVWGTSPDETVVIGDFRFDIECGRAAGSHTVLLTHAPDAAAYPNREQADLVLTSLADYPRLVAWLEKL